MSRVALVRHGQSVWNHAHRFTGWSDVPLSEKGVEEGRQAGRLLAAAGLRFDCCFTSVLERGFEAARNVIEGLGQGGIPVHRHWCLNERHFGALQGMSRWQAVRSYGPLRVLRWQRSYRLAPPPLEEDDPRFPGHDPLYASLDDKELPLSESLADTYARVVPYWEAVIVPKLRLGQDVLIVAHKNSLRVLIKHIEGISEADAPRLQIRTGHPLVYEFDEELRLRERRALLPEGRRLARWPGISPA